MHPPFFPAAFFVGTTRPVRDFVGVFILTTTKSTSFFDKQFVQHKDCVCIGCYTYNKDMCMFRDPDVLAYVHSRFTVGRRQKEFFCGMS